MIAKTLPLLLALFVSSIASSSVASSEWLKDCHPSECRIPADEMTPPEGARLSFSECKDGKKEDFVFELAEGAWRVTSYAMSNVPSCEPAGGP